MTLSTSQLPEQLPLRACQCSFCRRHGARTTSDPSGWARILVVDEALLSRYQFGLRTSEFFVCKQCGAYVAAVLRAGGRTLATINVNIFDDSKPFDRQMTPVDYSSESADERVRRRIERWMPADVVTCRRVRADVAEADALLDSYFKELASVLGGFDPARSVSAEPNEMAPPMGAFLVLLDGDRPIACGGLKTHEPGVGEIKRMFVVPDARARGLGRVVLSQLEFEARRLGMRRVVLDTAAPLTAAAALYRSSGYQDVEPFNQNAYAARWMAKDL